MKRKIFCILMLLTYTFSIYSQDIPAISNNNITPNLNPGDREILLDNLFELNQLIASYPWNDGTFFHRGQTLFYLSRFQEALVNFKYAIMLNPDVHEYYVYQIKTLYALGLTDQALESINQLNPNEPENAIIFLLRGIIHLTDLGESQEAIKDFTKALELGEYFDYVYLYRGIAHKDMGMLDEAYSDLSMEIKISGIYLAYLHRIDVLIMQNKYDEAISEANHGIAIAPEDSLYVFYTKRGEAFFQLNMFQEALNDFYNAIDYNAENPLLYNNLAIVYDSLYIFSDDEIEKQEYQRLSNMNREKYHEFILYDN